MESKTLYFLLALSVMVALATAYEEDDDDLFDDMFENYMEKRKGKGGGRRGGKKKKGRQGPCPDRATCWCAFDGDGGYVQLACAPTARGGQVGL
ncbi:hypothetical protein HOLleu_22477 [Holothuria leucospilota]|uniref:Uncharacterized protein n=1 Tax=Holothuria leucospilota TaxID=206669 RepID=A0A9Q1BXP8_HOLLE|nr:hypothetical protein HOLleu_22477 [Holothuria leucospilota]